MVAPPSIDPWTVDPVMVELVRIMGLPLARPLEPAEVEEISRIVLRPTAFARGSRLYDSQAGGVHAVSTVGGLFAPIRVAGGKCGLCMAAAQTYFRSGHTHGIYMIPSYTVGQFFAHQLPEWRSLLDLGGQVWNLHKRETRAGLVKRRSPGLYVFPYTTLQGRTGEQLLNDLQPSFIICDEADMIGGWGSKSARRDRFMRYWRKHTPNVCVASGTINKRKPGDNAHLARAALGDGSFLPHDRLVLQRWDELLGSYGAQEAFEDSNDTPGQLSGLIDWARKMFPGVDYPETRDGARRALRTRERFCPGVVISQQKDQCAASIEFRLIPASQEPGDELKRVVTQVEQMRSPSGDELGTPMEKWGYLRQLASGVANLQVWPDGVAEDVLERSKHALELQGIYKRELRDFLKKSIPHLDTDFLVGAALQTGKTDRFPWPMVDAWHEWKGKLAEGETVDRVPKHLRIDEFKIRSVIELIKSRRRVEQRDAKGCLVFAEYRDLRLWAYELMRAEGLDVEIFHPGTDSGVRLRRPENRHKVCLVSIKSHGRGLELHQWSDLIAMDLPGSADEMEQMLGRIKRPRQQASRCRYWFPATTRQEELMMAGLLVNTTYQQRRGQDDLILTTGDWVDSPPIFPPSYLHAQGLEVQQMNEAEERAFLARWKPGTN